MGGCWYSSGGGPSCAQHMSPGSPRPSPRARGWEQLATGRPLNKEPLSSVRACPARSGQLTLPGMPRPAPSVAYRVPRGGGTAGPGALGSVWGAPAPATGTPPGQGRAARTPSRDLPWLPTPLAPVVVWSGPHVHLSSGPPVCLLKSCLSQNRQASFSPRKALRDQKLLQGAPQPLSWPHVWLWGSQGVRDAFCPQTQFLLPVSTHASRTQGPVLNSRQLSISISLKLVFHYEDNRAVTSEHQGDKDKGPRGSWVVWQKDKTNPFIREARLHVQAQMRGAEPPGHSPSVAWGLGSWAVSRAPEPGGAGSAGPQRPLDCGPPSRWLRGFASG